MKIMNLPLEPITANPGLARKDIQELQSLAARAGVILDIGAIRAKAELGEELQPDGIGGLIVDAEDARSSLMRHIKEMEALFSTVKDRELKLRYADGLQKAYTTLANMALVHTKLCEISAVRTKTKVQKSYLTDIEGGVSYVQQSVEQSTVTPAVKEG